MKYKKVKTEADIKADPRIEQFVRNYDGYGKHMVACKTGFVFEQERTIDIGNMKEICDCINTWLDIDDRNK